MAVMEYLLTQYNLKAGISPQAPPSPSPPALLKVVAQGAGRYLTQSRRSVVGNRPHDDYLPEIHFLQSVSCEAQLLKIGQARAQRSVLGNGRDNQMEDGYLNLIHNHQETSGMLDDAKQVQDPELITESKDKMAVMEYLLTQYNLKAGLKHFGDKGVAAAESKLTQLHVMDTWVPEDPTKLTRVEKVKALSSLMFLKEKRCGKIKGRACVNGAPQRVYIPKEDAASPTMANELMFITSVIAAHEKHFVMCYNQGSIACENIKKYSEKNMNRIFSILYSYSIQNTF